MHRFGKLRDKGISKHDHFSIPEFFPDIGQSVGLRDMWAQIIKNVPTVTFKAKAKLVIVRALLSFVGIVTIFLIHNASTV